MALMTNTSMFPNRVIPSSMVAVISSRSQTSRRVIHVRSFSSNSIWRSRERFVAMTFHPIAENNVAESNPILEVQSVINTVGMKYGGFVGDEQSDDAESRERFYRLV